MDKSLISCLFFLLSFSSVSGQSVVINGYVKESGSTEPLVGANVRVESGLRSATTNTYGYFVLNIPMSMAQDSIVIFTSMAGYPPFRKVIKLQPVIRLDIILSPMELDQVIIKDSRENTVDQVQMGQIELSAAEIKTLPAIAGEKDALKILQLMPGVGKGTEGSSGIFVRGGGADQNLIILDEATVYNVNHLFGFFSVFNNDAVKNVTLIKGGFPAQYGGRLSSVVEVTMREGNRQSLHGEGGIGLISSRLTLEGPLKKNKSSFIISGRRTYLDVLLSPLLSLASNGNAKLGYFFYDLNTKLNYDIGKNDKVYFSGYFGKDKFYAKLKSGTYESQALFHWQNGTATARWNHLFNEKVFSNMSLIFTNYNFELNLKNSFSKKDVPEPFIVNLSNLSSITDYSIKYDVDYFTNPSHAFRFGLQSILHQFKPSVIEAIDTETGEHIQSKQQQNSFESAIYASHNWFPGARFKASTGLRIVSHATEGALSFRAEPRISVSYKQSASWAVKGSYAIMNQYVHLLSNTGAGFPTDLWVPTTKLLKPEQSKQVSLGLVHNNKQYPDYILSTEVYYKTMNHIVTFKEGANLLSVLDGPSTIGNTDWQNNVTSGKGWSYGMELLLRKRVGKLSGWIGYTWSKTYWQFQEVNDGKKYLPRNDRRHDLSVVAMLKVNKKISMSATWLYATGNHLTIARETYNAPIHYPNQDNYFDLTPYEKIFGTKSGVGAYGDKNSFQAVSYHRLDISAQFATTRRKYDGAWDIGLYNAYNRKNPFYYSQSTKIVNNKEVQILKRVSLFPVIPYVSYNFKF
ncbi:TonB-dependent receptor [Dyadobacter psychrotolerans]|uniref:TonB-dependent receptor n=1 Tax=Dyadobacter psychrotolerans TaxID=2541721 RepID=A0A4R5DED1_9BACT|nr:TonB-dependent receptor plug domain-containing protein [Dyadobacter psychrotolerans]TDE12139.1 TonB-dependent receptor [Dyadobacter psychrotolerans]